SVVAAASDLRLVVLRGAVRAVAGRLEHPVEALPLGSLAGKLGGPLIGLALLLGLQVVLALLLLVRLGLLLCLGAAAALRHALPGTGSALLPCRVQPAVDPLDELRLLGDDLAKTGGCNGLVVGVLPLDVVLLLDPLGVLGLRLHELLLDAGHGHAVVGLVSLPARVVE